MSRPYFPSYDHMKISEIKRSGFCFFEKSKLSQSENNQEFQLENTERTQYIAS